MVAATGASSLVAAGGVTVLSVVGRLVVLFVAGGVTALSVVDELAVLSVVDGVTALSVVDAVTALSVVGALSGVAAVPAAPVSSHAGSTGPGAPRAVTVPCSWQGTISADAEETIVRPAPTVSTAIARIPRTFRDEFDIRIPLLRSVIR